MSRAGPQYTGDPAASRTTRSKSWKMSERGWWTESRTNRFPWARRDRVMIRLWAVKLSRPDVGSSRIRIPLSASKQKNGQLYNLYHICSQCIVHYYIFIFMVLHYYNSIIICLHKGRCEVKTKMYNTYFVLHNH